MTSIGSPVVQTQPETIQIQQVPANFSMQQQQPQLQQQQQQQQTSLDQHSLVLGETNNISHQNIQIQNIANDLLRVCGYLKL